MAPTVTPLGPGTLSVGATGTEVDFSCQVTAATVSADVNADDPTTVLCGDSVPGARTYAWHIAGTLYQDYGAPAGIVEYSWDHAGEEVPFTFEPSTDVGLTVTGNLILDPLSIGGDEAGGNMTSDFDWSIVGTPTKTAGTPTAASSSMQDALV